MNIFERASRKALRFSSVKGDLTTEQLWQLNLNALDTVARRVNTELKSISEESFIATKPDPRKPDLELRLDILKHIIASKLADEEAAKTRAEKAAKKDLLLKALASKQNEAVANMSEAEIRAEIEAL